MSADEDPHHMKTSTKALFPVRKSDTKRSELLRVVMTEFGALIPPLVTIILEYCTVIPLTVSTLGLQVSDATRTVKNFDRPHYAVLWSPTQTAAARNSGKERFADDTVLLVTDYDQDMVKAVNLQTGKVSYFYGKGKHAPSIDPYDGRVIQPRRCGQPTGIDIHPIDNSVFFTEFSSHVIRRVSGDGVEMSVYGANNSGKCVDGARAVATFRSPFGIAISSCGKFGLVADYNHHRIRHVVLDSGFVTTLFGTGALDAPDGSAVVPANGSPLDASVGYPKAICWDPTAPTPDTVAYICTYNSLRRINIATREMTLIRAHSNYRPRFACWFRPGKLIVSSTSGICVTDTTPVGLVVDGPTPSEFPLVNPDDGRTDGPSLHAKFAYPTGLVLLPGVSSDPRFGGVDRLYVVDQTNNLVRVLSGSLYGSRLGLSDDV